MESKTKKIIIGITIVVALLLIGVVVALVVTNNNSKNNVANNGVIEEDPYVDVDPNNPGAGDVGDNDSNEDTPSTGNDEDDSTNGSSTNNQYEIYYETVTREQIIEAFELNVGWTALNLGILQNVATDIYAPQLLITKKLVKASDIENTVDEVNIGTNYYYVIEAINTGNYVAKDVVITDKIDASFLVSNDEGRTFTAGNNISIFVGDIATQSKVTVKILVKLNAIPGDHSKLTVKPGEKILNTAYADGSNILKRPSNTVETEFKLLTTDVVINHIYNDREQSAEDIELVTDIEIGTEYTGKARVEENYTSSGDKTIEVVDGENIINIYYTRKLTSVVINHIYDDREETKNDTEIVDNLKVGDEYTAIARNEINYASSGNATIELIDGENVINIYYTRKYADVIVNHIYDDREETAEDTEKASGLKVGTEYTALSRIEPNYTTTGDKTIEVRDGKNIVNIYYTRKYADVTVNHIYDDREETELDVETTTNVKVGVEFTAVARDEKNYTSSGNKTIEVVDGENVINIYYTRKLTNVTVNHIYDDREETESDIETTTNVKVGTTFTGVARDEKNYTTTGNKTIEVIDGENIINIYYTRKLANVVVNHIYDDREETVEDIETTNNVSVGTTFTGVARDEKNYTTTGNKTIEVIDGENIINIYYTRKYADVTVNHIYDDREETESDVETTNNVSVGTTFTGVARDEKNYTTTGNKTIEVVDGENVINIYYTRKLANVTVNHIYDDREETESDIETTNNIKVGTTFTAVARDEKNYTTTGNKTIEVIDGENVINIYYTRKLANVTVNHIYDDREETEIDIETTTNVSVGTTFTGEARDEKNYTTTGNKTIEVIDGENIINIYYTRKYADVTVNHIYDDREETAEDIEITTNIKVGTTFTGVARDEKNYTTTGNKTIEVVDGENVINIYYTRKLANVTVNHIYDDREETELDVETTNNIKVGTIFTGEARDEKNYTTTGDKTIEVVDGENIINIYYTRKLANVTVNHIYDDREETKADIETTTGVRVGTTFTGVARQEKYYTTTGNKTIEVVDGENIINIYYTRKYADVTVNHIYDDREETEADIETTNNIKVGTAFTGVARDEKNYSSTGNKTIEIVDGENIINIYYTRKYADVTVNHIYDDREETEADIETTTNIKVGTTFTGVARQEKYYTTTGDKTIEVVDGENVINIYYTRKRVNVVVNHIYDDREETAEDIETTTGVSVGTTFTGIAREDKNYTTTGNKTIEIVDGENIINIYYTRKYADVTVNHIYDDREETESDVETTTNIKVGIEFTAEARDEKNYTSSGDKTIEVVDGENVINIYYTRKYADVVVNHIYDDREETESDVETTTNIKVGTTFTGVARQEKYYTTTGDKTIEVVDGENIINIYYTRKRVNVVVNHIYNDREETAEDVETIKNVGIGTTFTGVARDEKNYTTSGNKTIDVVDGENIINIYYTRKLTSVVVNHIYDDREETDADREIVLNVKVGDEYTGVARKDVYYSSTGNKTITLVDGENIINIYYTRLYPNFVGNKTGVYNPSNQTITYTITVENNGDAPGVTSASDDLNTYPSNVYTFAENINILLTTEDVTLNGSVIEWNNISLNKGQSKSIKFTVKLKNTVKIGTTIVNKSSVGEEQVTLVEQNVKLTSKSMKLTNKNVILVMDISGSMTANNKLTNALNAARSFINQAFAEGDNSGMTMTLISFSGKSTKWAEGVSTKAEALKAVDDLEEHGYELGTRMDLGLLAGSEAMAKLADSNGNDTILVFLGDGAPTGGSTPNTPQNLINTAQLLRTKLQALYTIGFDVAEGSSTANLLKNMSSMNKVYISGIDELDGIFSSIATQILNKEIVQTTNKGIFTYKDSVNGISKSHRIVVTVGGSSKEYSSVDALPQEFTFDKETNTLIWDVRKYTADTIFKIEYFLK